MQEMLEICSVSFVNNNESLLLVPMEKFLVPINVLHRNLDYENIYIYIHIYIYFHVNPNNCIIV